MRYTADAIWSEMLSEFDDREDPYLRLAKPVAITREGLTISVSTPITQERIEERFLADINRFLEKEIGQGCTLTITVVEPDVPKPSNSPLVPSSTPEETAAGKTPPAETGLNPQYTFERFVVGPSNRLSHAAALRVSDNPGKEMNPLFIYGGVGLGKTHLLRAIGNRVKAIHPHLKVVYVTSETFMNEYIDSIISSRTTSQDFRSRYRTADVLLIDDIQFLQRKEGTQEEFFNTFNELHLNSNHIVMTSDRPPKNLENLHERLRSRFEWGMVADISPPQFETRVAILRQKCEDNGFTHVPDSVLEYIAEIVQTHIRDLEGTLVTLVANASVFKQELTTEFARRVLSDNIPPPPLTYRRKTITAEEIQKTVAGYFRVKVSDLKSSRRTRTLVVPRQIAMYLCRQLTNLSLQDIASAFGKRDHTTIMHACDRTEEAIEQDAEMNQIVHSLIEGIK
ncbi:MAG: chromosomal replication initiator protein DnaA [Candidatus Poribacteria bacterium]